METTNCIANNIAKTVNIRRKSHKTTENTNTMTGEPTSVVLKSTLATEVTQPTCLVVAKSSSEPMLTQSQQPSVVAETNCAPKKITKRRYTRRNSCKTSENPFTLVEIPKTSELKPQSLTYIMQPNCTLLEVKSSNEPMLSQSQSLVVNDTNCIAKKITKRRYTRRKSCIPTENPSAKVNELTATSVHKMSQPTYAIVHSKSPSKAVSPQPEPPAVNDTNCAPKKITKRRYTRRNSNRTTENPFTASDITTPVVLTSTPAVKISQPTCTPLVVKSPNESVLPQSQPTVGNDTNCVPKKITKRSYIRRNSCRNAESSFNKVDTPTHIVLTSSPVIVTPRPIPKPEPLPPVEINHVPENEIQQSEEETKLWYHMKAYNFLKSLKQDYKRFKYLFNYLLHEEQEKEHQNIKKLDELKGIYNRMQVEETEIKRKRWCRYCELEATYLTVGMQFYCSKECERKQNNLLSAIEDSFEQYTE